MVVKLMLSVVLLNKTSFIAERLLMELQEILSSSDEAGNLVGIKHKIPTFCSLFMVLRKIKVWCLIFYLLNNGTMIEEIK
jgi:hypothetical protein